MKAMIITFVLALAIMIIAGSIGMGIGNLVNHLKQPCDCPETLPTTITDMFTIKGDTLIINQGVDFVISTRGADVDTAGIIHRKFKAQ